MKLKLVVASMSLLGLVSCPVFAATDATTTTDSSATTATATATSTDTTTTTATAPVKKPHVKHHVRVHHRVHHVVVTHHVVASSEPVNFKNEVLQPAPVEVCTVSPNTMVMDGMTQSIGRSMPNPCNPGWFNRIQLSGGLNVDMGKWGSRNTGYMGENFQRVALNDAYINLAANVNDWTKAFASVSFMNATTLPDGFGIIASNNNLRSLGEYSAAYANNIQGNGNNVIQLEQAYATLGNLDQIPVFLQVGKSFQDFGRYEIHPITASMTQVMSETLATSAKLGFIVPMGFNGSIYAFDDPVKKFGHGATTTNYGASLGYDLVNDQLGFDLGIGYLYNMIGVNDVAYAVQNFTFNSGYFNRVGAIAAYGDVNSGPFTLSARYTTALQRFNVLDLPKNSFADDTVTTVFIGGTPVLTTITPGLDRVGAKPWAAGAQAGYGFEAFGCKSNNVYIGYQTSREAAGLALPKNRWLAGYGIEWWKNTNFGVEWDHDVGYSFSQGGTGRNSNLVSLRAGVLFG